MNKEYFAFISYQRQDEDWAKWLADQLEHYHLPLIRNGRDVLPKDLRPIFRDIDELSAGNLPQQIHQALENSKNLIVVCSPNSAKSPWVNKEVETFIEMGKLDYIFPFIIDGVAFSKNKDEECLPKALLNLSEDKERLGANVREFKDGPQRLCKDCPLPKNNREDKKQGNISDKGPNAAVVKIVAGMLGLNFDTLWQRYEKEKVEEERRIKEQRDKLLIAQSRFIAEKANALVDGGDSSTASLLALEVLPKDLENPERPYTVEAEVALRKALASEFSICKGHKSFVKSVCYSPHNNYIMSASEDDNIIIWDARLGRPISQQNSIFGKYAQFSPDEQQIASVDSYGKAYIWDFKTFSKLTEFPGFSFISYSPDGQFVVTGGEKSCVNIWSVSGKLFKSLEGHSDRVNHAVFSPNNLWIASASFDKTIRIWEFETGQLMHILKGHSDIIWHVAFSPDNKFLASAADDKKIMVWDCKSWEIVATFEEHYGRVNSIAFSPDGSKLISVSSDGRAIIWDMVEKQMISNLNGDKWKADEFAFPTLDERKSIYDVSYSPNGKSVVTAHQDETIRIWNLSCYNIINTLKGHKSSVNYLSFSPDDNYIASASADLNIRIWNVETGRSIKILIGHDSYISSVEYSPNGQYIVSASADKTIKIWDVQSGEIIHTLAGHSDFVRYATFNCDGSLIASASLDATIKIWNAHTGELIKTLIGHNAEVSFVSFSNNGEMIASSSEDNTILLWNLKEGKPIKSFIGHSQYINSVHFSHDDKTLLSCSLDNSIRTWDINTGHQVTEITGDTRYIYSARFSPDEKYIVSAVHGNDVKVWNANTGTLILTIKGHEAQINATLFNHQGNIIASCSEDRTVKIWEFLPLQQLIDETKKRFKDVKLTPEERKIYYLD